MTNVLDRGTEIDLSRDLGVGSARLIFAPMTTPQPTDIGDMIYVDALSNANEVQSLATSGTPTGGTFKLKFRGQKTGTIVYNAAASVVQAALEALSTVGVGGVVCTGGPLPSAVVVTFSGTNLAAQNVPTITVAEPAFTGGTSPAAAVTVTTPGVGIYECKPGWLDLGPTLGGITISHNNTEQTYTVDQINADIFTLPNGATMTIASAVSKTDLDTMKLLWEGGAISTIAASGNRRMGLGPFLSYTQRRVGLISERPSLDGDVTPGALQVVYFRITQREPAESTLVYQKEGTQRAPAFTWKVLPDTTIVDPRERFALVFDQA